MMLTTVVSEAKRMIDLEYGPEYYTLSVGAICIGKIAFVGVPGEPFTGIGREIKAIQGFDIILPFCCTNDAAGYFPTTAAYDEGGYEARSSRFKKGVAESIVNAAKELLDEIK